MLNGSPFSDDHAFLQAAYAAITGSSAPGALTGIEKLVTSLRPPSLDSICHRIVLAHLDSTLSNILTVRGAITGVIDWEFHGLLPLYLAAQDLPWLQYQGHEDAGRFDPVNPATGLGITIWLERRPDAQQYIDAYDKVSLCLHYGPVSR